MADTFHTIIIEFFEASDRVHFSSLDIHTLVFQALLRGQLTFKGGETQWVD